MNSSTLTQQTKQNWSIVFFGFLALALAFSGRAALGLVMPVWESELGWSRSFVSGVAAIALIHMAIIAPFAGRLADKKGPRFCLILGLSSLTIGALIIAVTTNKYVFAIGFAGFCAVGFGIVATHIVATAVARNFDRQLGLATGIATSGATGGQFLIVPLIAILLTFASWRWSFAGLSLGCFLLIICIFLFLKKDQTAEQTTTEKTKTTLGQDVGYILKQPVFSLLFWSFLICGFTTTGVIETHLIPYAAYCGFPAIPSAAAYGLLSAVNLLGMIGAGWLTDRVNRPLLLGAIYALRGLTFILLASLPNAPIETLFIFAALFGLVDYSTVPATVSLVASHVGKRVMGLALGMVSAGHALGGALGAYYGGRIFDTTGNYDQLWTTSLWLSGVAVILSILIPKNAAKLKPAQENRSIN